MVIENSKLKIILAFFVLLVIGLTSSFGMSFWRDNQALENEKGNIVSLKENKTGSRKFWLPSGKETYRIAQAEEVWPKILEATIDPPDVHVGDRQKLTVIVQSPEPIEFVEARTQLDNQFKVIPLKFVGEVAKNKLLPNPYVIKDGKLALRLGGLGLASRVKSLLSREVNAEDYPKLKYEAEWIVYDTHDAVYRMAFVVKTVTGQESVVTLAWSDACAIPMLGDWYLSSIGNCTISSPDGIEDGNANINSANNTLTLNSTFAINPGYSIQVTNGSIAVGTGGSIIWTYIWAHDPDADRYTNPSQDLRLQDTDPGLGWDRRNTKTAIGDCRELDENAFQDISNLNLDLDRDGYSSSASFTKCVGAPISYLGRTYYWESTEIPECSSAYYVLSSQVLGTDTDDCNASVH